MNIPTNRGIITTVILIVVALLILSYFGYNLRSIASSPTTQDNFSYVGEVISNVWNNYLKTPATVVWNIFIDLIWHPAINTLQHQNTPEANMQSTGYKLPTPGPIQ